MKVQAFAMLLVSTRLVQVLAQISSRAQTLGLNRTWTAPLPLPQDTNYTSSSSVSTYISQQWSNPINYFYGPADVSFVPDPYGGNSSVVKVLYAKGSYSPSAARTSGGVTGGAEFYSMPFGNQSFTSALLRYDLAFDQTFNWKQGGKLPGLFGGPPGTGCSGGDEANGTNCFSTRVMWRSAGLGEAYAYIPSSTSLCKQPLVMCNDDYGTSFSRGVITFKTQQWTTLEMFIQLNNASQSNGILRVWQDNNLVINQESLQFRTTNALAISSLMFSTFFGGSTSQYATPVDTYTYYRNIQFSVGTTAFTSQSNTLSHTFVNTPTLLLAGMALFILVWR